MKSHRIRVFLGGDRLSGVKLAEALIAQIPRASCPPGELPETWPCGSLRDAITKTAIDFAAASYREDVQNGKGRWYVTMGWTKDHVSVEIYIYRNIFSVLT